MAAGYKWWYGVYSSHDINLVLWLLSVWQVGLRYLTQYIFLLPGKLDEIGVCTVHILLSLSELACPEKYYWSYSFLIHIVSFTLAELLQRSLPVNIARARLAVQMP